MPLPISIDEVAQRLDPALAYKYSVELPSFTLRPSVSDPSRKALKINDNLNSLIPGKSSSDTVSLPPSYIESVFFQFSNNLIDQLLVASVIRSYAGKVVTAPITIRFYEDAGYNSSNYISIWKSLILNDDGTFNYPDEYKRDINIYLQDSQNTPVFRIIAHDCWPESNSPIGISYSEMGRQVVTQTFNSDLIVVMGAI